MANPVDVATGYLRALEGDDPEAVVGHVADMFRNEHLSALASDSTGSDEYRRRLPHFFEQFRDRSYEIEDLVEQRRDAVTDVVVRYRFHAHHGDVRVAVPGVMWLTVREDRITRRVDVFDSLTFLRQTGQSDPTA